MIERAEQYRGQSYFNFRVAGMWIVFLIIFIAQLLVYTWCRMQCIHIGYEISMETDNWQQLLTIQNRLKIEMERLRSPERIADIAAKRLGMITPTSLQKIEISSNDNDKQTGIQNGLQ
ncbi:MAG: hypothetical protein AB7S75_18630 [Desulfococcaceae bacterium]